MTINEEYFHALDSASDLGDLYTGILKEKNESVIARHSNDYPEAELPYIRVAYWIFLLSKNPNCDDLVGHGITFEGKGRDKIIDCHYSKTRSPVNKIRNEMQHFAERDKLDACEEVLKRYGSSLNIVKDRFTGDTLWLHTQSGKINCGIISEID